jgi:hypothetical protein
MVYQNRCDAFGHEVGDCLVEEVDNDFEVARVPAYRHVKTLGLFDAF